MLADMYDRKLIVLLAISMCILAVLAIAWSHASEIPLAIVKCNSMLPLLREGDIVFVIRVPPEDIQEGDIIIYKTQYNTLIIHRVISVSTINGKYYYITRGDNNPYPDYRYFENGKGIPYERVVGKVLRFGHMVLKIPYIGNLALMLKGESCV